MFPLRWCAGMLVFTCLVVVARGQDEDLQALVHKAIVAHGGAENIAKFKAATTKFKGKLEIMNLSLDITGDQSYQAPDKFRVSTAFQINNMNIESIQVFDGKSFWVSVLGKTMEIKDDKMIKELKETMAVERAGGLIQLLKKDYELSLVGEIKVKDRDAIGIRASKKGQRDLNLFLDKKTHLLVKTEYRARPPMGGDQEVTQEKYFLDYKEVMGMKVPGRVVIEQDGKMFMDLEVSEVRMFESLGDEVFAKP